MNGGMCRSSLKKSLAVADTTFIQISTKTLEERWESRAVNQANKEVSEFVCSIFLAVVRGGGVGSKGLD